MDIVLRPSSFAIPSSSRDVFGREAPLFVEIGVGNGSFIANLARAHPEVNVLGVDRAPQSIARSYRRVRDGDAENIRLIKADAFFVIGTLLAPGAARRVYVNYPDPWPRRKHRERRLLRRPFFELVRRQLGADGDLLLTTDHREYFEYALAQAEGLFHIHFPSPPAEILETKWAKRGAQYHHAVLEPIGPQNGRAVGGDDTNFHIQILDEMYHAVLEGELPELHSFEKQVFKHRHGTTVVLDAYRMLDGDGMAFLVHVQERHLSQEVIIEAKEGKQGYLVTLKRFGEPMHTRAVGESVRHIVEWLEAAGMRVVHRKY